ncbi:MAG: saccharopine dehydrogenase C-terminal domain-containing protein [Flavobacteriales bacterium]|nr:saccharopine dehydrogenase C-terminal domain-containing protein [Flavobacteriales bacterium]
MAKIIVLGAGMVGSAMARDLSGMHEVTSADISQKALDKLNAEFWIGTVQLDLSKKQDLQSAIAPFDLVVCAVPGFMGFQTLRWIIEAGKDVADISFFPENCLELDALAKEHGVTAIVDVGVAPGMDNLILGYLNEKMDIDTFECLVGGLPKVKKWPFAYKAPFSPIDVIEEYTRPARYVENGIEITRAPLTDAEFVEFEKVGTLESFNTDGLRSIIHTMGHIPNMKEKTLRYPGHIDLIKALQASGFFSEEKMEGLGVSPLEFTSNILLDEWKLGADEEEFTVMRVTVSSGSESIVYHLYDEYDPITKVSSMARTTGYTCTAAAELILQGHFTEKGVFPPELVGSKAGCFDFVMAYLKERNVTYTVTS